MSPSQRLFSSNLISFFLLTHFIAIISFGQDWKTYREQDGIKVWENDKQVFLYQQFPKSIAGKFERAGYIHPLYNLNGKILTEDFPEDHPYHRGVFWAWHQIILKNKKIADEWTCENISWHSRKLKVFRSDEKITLQSEMIWKSIIHNNRPTGIIKENTRITVYRSEENYRLIDFDIGLLALVDSLKIGGSDDVKGYGGFCLRLKLPADVSFVSDNGGVIPMETPVTAGPWMDITGSLGGDSLNKSGVAVFINPGNPGYSPQWILRKEKSMQNVPYPGREPVELSNKKVLRLRYRIVIHNDKMERELLEKLFQQYVIKS